MAKTSIEIDKELKKQCTLFLKNTDSNMHYLADLDSTLGSTEWLEIMEESYKSKNNRCSNRKSQKSWSRKCKRFI